MLDQGWEIPTGLPSQGRNHQGFESVFCCYNKVLETGSFKRKESYLCSRFQTLYRTSGGFGRFRLLKTGRWTVEGQTGVCDGGGDRTPLQQSALMSLIQSWKNSINPPWSKESCHLAAPWHQNQSSAQALVGANHIQTSTKLKGSTATYTFYSVFFSAFGCLILTDYFLHKSFYLKLRREAHILKPSHFPVEDPAIILQVWFFFFSFFTREHGPHF